MQYYFFLPPFFPAFLFSTQSFMDIVTPTEDNIVDSSHSVTHVPLKRTRAKRSCDFCRKRKSRCDADNTMPCSNCRAVNNQRKLS